MAPCIATHEAGIHLGLDGFAAPPRFCTPLAPSFFLEEIDWEQVTVHNRGELRKQAAVCRRLELCVPLGEARRRWQRRPNIPTESGLVKVKWRVVSGELGSRVNEVRVFDPPAPPGKHKFAERHRGEKGPGSLGVHGTKKGWKSSKFQCGLSH